MKNQKQFLLFSLLFIFLFNFVFGSNKPGEAVGVNVFLDSKDIDVSFLKENFQQVNYVINREDANVHILGTSQKTGSGGKEFAFYFIGLNNFQGVRDTLYYFSSASNTATEVRDGYTNTIKMGLVRYLAHASQIINLQFPQEKKSVKPVATQVDKWRNWVFSVNANGRLEGQKTRGSRTLNLSANGTKTTEAWRIEFLVNNMDDEDWFRINDSTKITSTQISRSFTNLTVRSIGRHMAIGLESSAKNSSFNNQELAIAVSPAIEYDFFPYSVSSRKQLRIAYYLGYNSNKYKDTTIFNKISETLFKQRLQLIYQVKEEWGSISGSVIGSTYLHDLKRNNLAINTWADFRVWKGLSISVSANYSLINDQLSLAKGDMTLDQQLLKQRQQATTYQFGASLGLKFTFGSMFNNVVNPRLSSLSWW
jgi:hypothetical protein